MAARLRSFALQNYFSICQERSCTYFRDAGWSSLVARQAHNLKAAGSNPAPATKFLQPRCPIAFTLSKTARENFILAYPMMSHAERISTLS
jgi:hypothetical protein